MISGKGEKMAGIGIRLNKFYKRRSLLSRLGGFAYILGVSVLPMFLVIVAVIIMEKINGFEDIALSSRELFAASIMYCFIFSLLCTSVFNAVFSRYLSDLIYEERFDAIKPCFIFGLFLNAAVSSAFALPFYIRAYIISDIGGWYLFFSYFLFMGLAFSFYSMLYLSITKDYVKITVFYLIAMAVSVLLSVIFVRVFGMDVDFAMLVALGIGFLLVASMNSALTLTYFKKNDGSFTGVLSYFRAYWQIILSNFMYILTLYVHNFVFWGSDMGATVARVYRVCEPYDMASFLAMLTNISATAIFISNMETNFHVTYKKFSESITGGRYSDIKASKERMLTSLSSGLLALVRVQFIISVIIFLLFMIVLPRIGFAGTVMVIYPVLSAAFFVIFLSYGTILYTYYFDDTKGAMIMTGIMLAGTFTVSLFAKHLPVVYYGLGPLCGSFAGWTYGYFRLKYMAKHLETHIFCRGTIVQKGEGIRPDSVVYEK